MTNEPVLPANKEELIERITSTRQRLDSYLESLSNEDLTGPADEAGWTPKDHIAHLAIWEQSMVGLLEGTRRNEIFGVSKDLYDSHDVDAINAEIQQQHASKSMEDVFTMYRDAHFELMTLIDRLSFEDLNRPYSYYVPDEPGEVTEEPILHWILGNTEHHFQLHQDYIAQILDR